MSSCGTPHNPAHPRAVIQKIHSRRASEQLKVSNIGFACYKRRSKLIVALNINVICRTQRQFKNLRGTVLFPPATVSHNSKDLQRLDDNDVRDLDSDGGEEAITLPALPNGAFATPLPIPKRLATDADDGCFSDEDSSSSSSSSRL